MKTMKSSGSSREHTEKVERNDPCPCSSGKKYKKCCESKKEKPATSTPKMVQITFTTEPVIEEMDYDIPSEDDQETISRLYHRLNHHPETIESEEDEYFLTLNQLQEKYSNYPALLNYMTMGYNILGLNDKVRELIFDTYNKFPQYLFAMTGVANIYLNEGKPEKALEIFGNAKSLPEIYPNRNVFHVAEGRIFHHTMAYYYCIKGEVTLAQNQLKLLESVSKMMEFENDPLVQHIRFEILKIGGQPVKNGFAILKSMLGL